MAFRLGEFQYFDDNGDPLNGGKVYVYAPGTTTPKDSYPTADDADAGTNANANPVVLNSAGRGQVWGKSGETYKIVIQTSAGVTLDMRDDITAPDVNFDGSHTLLTAGGTANALTATTTNSITLSNSSFVWVLPTSDNTGATTLNVDSLGAKKVFVDDGTDLKGGELVASRAALLHYDTTADSGTGAWMLLNPAVVKKTGSFTIGTTGFSGTAPSGTASYTIINDVVYMEVPDLIGTSNANTFTLTGIPAAIRPSSQVWGNMGRGVDNNTGIPARVQVNTDGTATMYTGTSTGWTDSSTKALTAQLIIWVLP